MPDDGLAELLGGSTPPELGYPLLLGAPLELLLGIALELLETHPVQPVNGPSDTFTAFPDPDPGTKPAPDTS